MFFSVTYGISRLFPNTLTADNKSSLRNGESLQQPIQMQLFKKEKTVSDFLLLYFWNLHHYSGHFETKFNPDSIFVFKITDCERGSKINV